MSLTNGVNTSNGHVERHLEIKMEPSLEERKKQEARGVRYQIITSLIANSSILGPAMGFGYSAVALGPMMDPSNDLKIDEVQGNWIATAAALSIPLGCVLSSYTMRRGRKFSLLITSVISIIGWVIIYTANSYGQILAGRVISGIATGLAAVPATVYSAEIAAPHWRSTMVTWTSIAIALGVLIVYIFGYIFQDDWRTVALMCALFPLLAAAVTLAIVPETPIWLRDRGRLDEALEILKRFRGVPKNQPPTPELFHELQQRPQKKKQNLIKHLRKRNAIVPFIIMLSYFFFQQFSGLFVVVYYAVDIIRSAGITIDPYLGAVLIGLTRLVGSFLVACVSRKFGRRIPSIASGTGMTIFMGILSVYLFCQDRGYTINDRALIPVICVLMYIFMSTLGFLVIPFAMVGEIYPTKVKDVLTGLTTCIGYIFSSVTVKTYPDMLNAMGKHGVFFFYGVVSLIGTIFVVFCLPETKGKTLREIEDMFRRKQNVDSRDEEKIVPLKDLSAP